jgi:predicted O-methyltransferase YrrM
MNLESVTNHILDNIDMTQIQRDAYHDVNNYISQKSGQNHYRLLTYISTLFDNKKILDVGTFKGWSALALSYNKNNTVISYDLCDSFPKSASQLKENIEYRIGNFLNNSSLILEAPFIFLDIDPHDGIQEELIFRKLNKIGFKGIVMLDDIHYFEGMNKFYNNLAQRKIDITHIGHSTGSAVVYFK